MNFRLPSDSEFLAYHSAFLSRKTSQSFHYDLGGNFIFAPVQQVETRHAFDLLHEFAHSQIGNGVLGMTLQACMECASILEQSIFPKLSVAFERYKDVDDGTIYRELFLFGEVRSETAKSLFIADGLESCFVVVDAELARMIASFKRIMRRFRDIVDRWSVVHEATAIQASIYADRDLDHEGAFAQYLLKLLGLAPEVVQRELMVAASLCRKRYQENSVVPRSYQVAFKLGEECYSRFGNSGVWIASLVAGHFDFHQFRLFDMTDEEYELAASTKLDFTDRYRRLLEQESALNAASRCVTAGDIISEDQRKKLLSIASGNTLETENDSNFWRWEREHLWLSSTMNIVKPEHFCGAPAFENPETFDGGRRFDFRIPDRWFPPIIDAAGRVIAEDPIQTQLVRKRFVQMYEVDRTFRLLSTIHRWSDS